MEKIEKQSKSDEFIMKESRDSNITVLMNF